MCLPRFGSRREQTGADESYSTQDESPRQVMTGFARNVMLGLAAQVIAAVKAGNIRQFFLVGGCDGAKPDLNYYTELVEKIPRDCVLLTLTCGKFRLLAPWISLNLTLPRLRYAPIRGILPSSGIKD